MNRDTSYTLVPVNRILRIFLLTNVTCKSSNIDPNYSIFKSVMMILTLAVVNTIVLISNLVSFNPVYHHIQFHNSIHTIYWLWYSEYILDLFYLYKTRQTFLKYLEFYKTIDGLIQVPNFIAMRTTLTRICIWFVLSFILISMFDFMSWRIGSGFWIS